MDANLEYLLSSLQDEFRERPDVVVRATPMGGRKKSPDLEPADEDYRPREQGVIVRTRQREYFFPVSWIAHKQYGEVHKLSQQIKDLLD